MSPGPASSSPPSASLVLQGIHHSFGGVQAVRGVDLELRGGEVCALLGENGAGKSTLMKAVTGALRHDRGEVRLDGEALPRGDPGAVRRRGVAVVYQELNLVGPLPVHENVALGRERRRGPLVDRAAQRRHAAELLAGLDAPIDPDAAVETLSVAERQMVEIARALSERARVLVLDEPTSALSGRETERLFAAVRRLVKGGVAVVFITHRLEEVRRLADRVVVMRDGAVVADGARDDYTDEDLVKAMVGRALDRQFPARRRSPGEVRLEVRDLSVPPRVAGVGFAVRAGEVVALAGLVGAGRTEVGRALFGAAPGGWRGSVRLDGRPVAFRHPHEAVEAGVGWVSEDRKAEGLVASMSVLANLTLPHLGRFAAAGGWIDRGRERQAASAASDRFRIRSAGLEQAVSELSGGNQQKVVLARWLLEDCRLLVCDEPTRGVDVGGRYEIYEFLEELVARGIAVLMISSDLPEVLGMADRIVVMHEGRVAGELDAAGASQQDVLTLGMGGAR